MILARAQQLDGRAVLIVGLTPEDWATLEGREIAYATADLVEADTGLEVGLALVAGINDVEISSAIIRHWRSAAEVGTIQHDERG